MKIRSIKRLGLTICTVAPMLATSSCSTKPNAASMLLMAPVILPIAGIHAINQAEVRANGYAPASKPRPRSYHRWSDQKKIESTGMSRSRGYSGPHIVHSGNPRRKVLEGTYKDGKWEGLWTGWHDNGQKQFEGTYKKGKKVSFCRCPVAVVQGRILALYE